jgi:hypothetical protein
LAVLASRRACEDLPMPADDLPPIPPYAPAPGRYRHYKGNEYEVLHTARHSEHTDEFLVVYRPLRTPDAIWVRPLEMFVEQVDLPGGAEPRFAPVG